MIKKIVGGIARQIFREFGDNQTVYSEEVRQGFRQPCFVIKLVKSQCQKGIGGRNKFINSFLILYFPGENSKNEKMGDVSKRLFDCLEFIDAGRVIRGTDMKSEKAGAINLNGISSKYENGDGILHFYVNYNFHEILIGGEDYMERLEID